MSEKLEELILGLLGELMGALKDNEAAAFEVENPAQIVAFLQLKSVLTVLETLGIKPFVVAPLVELLAALDDARVGISNPLLAPQKLSGKKPRSGPRVRLLDGLVWIRGVEAVELLLDASPSRSGSDVKSALGKVAPLLGRLLGRKTVTQEDLASRRKELNAGRGSPQFVADYNRHLGAQRKRKGLTKQEIAERALEFLRSRARSPPEESRSPRKEKKVG